MTDSWKNQYYWENYWHLELFEWENPEGEERLRYPENDRDPYWDVLGDGWNPGHTMHEGEIHLEERTLSCFRRGYVDRKRWIYWKYMNKPYEPPPQTREEVRERLLRLASMDINEYFPTEVEDNE